MTEHDNNRVLYDLFLSFTEIHTLRHGVHGELYGLAVSKELGRHGYPESSGTMNSMRHEIERVWYLSCTESIVGGKVRR